VLRKKHQRYSNIQRRVHHGSNMNKTSASPTFQTSSSSLLSQGKLSQMNYFFL
jgi:hypothetical protein